MLTIKHACISSASRSPHGERGLKCDGPCMCLLDNGRSPHGERGLKYNVVVIIEPINVALLMESVD